MPEHLSFTPIEVATALALYGYNVSPRVRAQLLWEHFDGDCADIEDLVLYMAEYGSAATGLAYPTALLYYQRVWQWDPQTPLPVRFAVADVYDEELHDRVKALHWYEKAINFERAHPANVLRAKNRIEEINRELQKK